jgi:hypothetical protein
VSEQTGSWQPDPFGRHQYRYWNGSEWTDQVANDGVTSVDPAVADTAPAVAPDAPAESAAEPGADAPAEPAAGVPSEPAPTTPEPVAPPAPVAPSAPQGWAAPDATTAMPASPPPPAAGTPGGPGEPLPPTETGGGGGGSNLPGILVGVVVLALILGAAAWFLFLRDDGDDEDRATVVSALRDELGLSSSEANCVADELADRSDLEAIARAIEDDREPTGAQAIAIMQAFEACDVDPTLLDGDSAADTTTTTDDTDTTDDTIGPGGSIPPALLDLIAQGIMEESGLSREQARCFAQEIFTLEGIDFTNAMSDPDAFGEDMMSDPGMVSSFFEIFERCDIDPSEFDGGGTDSSGFQPGDSYGDNPVLDRLWDRCEDGDGEACDELYFTSEVGSEYEEFGDTCGGRFPGGTVFCANEDLS